MRCHPILPCPENPITITASPTTLIVLSLAIWVLLFVVAVAASGESVGSESPLKGFVLDVLGVALTLAGFISTLFAAGSLVNAIS